MRTTQPMTTDETLARKHGWTLVNWDAAYEAACDSLENQPSIYEGFDVDDDRQQDLLRKSVADVVTNSWEEGLSHDAWTNRAMGRFGR